MSIGMKSKSGLTQSLWFDHQNVPKFTPLGTDESCDVCIIGAGISGLTAAYLLLKEGKSVVVLDRRSILDGDTGRTTAHLSPLMDDGLERMEKLHGHDGAVLTWKSHSEAINRIEEIVKREKIDCEFLRVDGFLFGEIESEYQAAVRTGIPVVRVERAPIPGGKPKEALRFPNQAEFHVVKYLKRLAEIISERGGKIHTDTPVTDVEWGTPATVKTANGHSVKANNVIEAANSMATGSVRTMTKLYPYRTYVVALEIPRGEVKSLLWDTEDPYHYVRSESGGMDQSKPDLLIVGGEDHKTGQANNADERYRHLEKWAREHWPKAGAVAYRWSGQVLETPDGLALIGQNPGNPENSFLISGDSGHGMTHGTLGAMILTDLITGKENAYTKLYEPCRLHPESMGTWLKENANAGKQYVDWIPGYETTEAAKIPNGEGAIVQNGIHKLAVYKDEHGKVNACSAVCPHLGGIVQWNNGEKTWDCPCHGSRFDRFGKAIATPALSDLSPAEMPTN